MLMKYVCRDLYLINVSSLVSNQCNTYVTANIKSYGIFFTFHTFADFCVPAAQQWLIHMFTRYAILAYLYLISGVSDQCGTCQIIWYILYFSQFSPVWNGSVSEFLSPSMWSGCAIGQFIISSSLCFNSLGSKFSELAELCIHRHTCATFCRCAIQRVWTTFVLPWTTHFQPII